MKPRLHPKVGVTHVNLGSPIVVMPWLPLSAAKLSGPITFSDNDGICCPIGKMLYLYFGDHWKDLVDWVARAVSKIFILRRILVPKGRPAAV